MGKCLSTTIRKASDIASKMEDGVAAKMDNGYKKISQPMSSPDNPLDEEPPLLSSKVAMYEDEEIDKIFE